MHLLAPPLLAVTLLSSAFAGCADEGPPGAATKDESSDASAAPSYVTARLSTGNKPCGILGVDGKVWVSNYADDTLVAIDPRAGTVGPTIPTGDQPCGLAVGAGSIWVEDYGSDEVTRVSLADGSVEATYAVGSQPYDVTFAAGAAWVTNYSDGSVSRIDAGSGKVTRIETGGTPIGIAPAGGKVWVGLGVDSIAGIDTATGAVTDTIETDDAAGWTAYDAAHVWVNVAGTVVEVDPSTATITRTVAVGDKPEDGSVVAGEVWVGDASGDLYRFPVAGDATEAQAVPATVHNPFVAAELEGQLWVVDFDGTDVVAIDPAKVD